MTPGGCGRRPTTPPARVPRHAMALNECGCGCNGAHKGQSQAEWTTRLANIVDHVAPARTQAALGVATPGAGTLSEPVVGAAPGFAICLDAAALPPGATVLDGRLSLIICPAGAVAEPRLHVSSDRCECRERLKSCHPSCRAVSLRVWLAAASPRSGDAASLRRRCGWADSGRAGVHGPRGIWSATAFDG